jgi:hypothetical protein
MIKQSSAKTLQAIADLLGTQPTAAMVAAALKAAYSLGRCDQVVESTKVMQNELVS